MSENSLGRRGVGRGSAASRKNVSTMNRPDSGSLNSNAQATVAASVFARMQQDELGTGNAPAIANGFIPPVVEKKEEVKASPFKTVRPPVKRPSGLGLGASAGSADQAGEEEDSSDKKSSGPQIAKFTPIPVLDKPASPFVPLTGASSVNQTASVPSPGMKPQIKRPINALANHSTISRPSTANRPVARKSAFGNKVTPVEPEPIQAADEPVRTQDKTFVPLAPVPFFVADKEEPINPFAAPVKKTEEEKLHEERALQKAMEQTRSVEPRKSALDKIMDELHRPLF